ncbi:riboflavin biosynthesis protein PYRR, chloroplastic-like isoform X2 [Triticum dicoccoides]|uniref:riboflavin biosynthesis protein PYRR, chloroplastic-like isoform X2 n=1 Tax=Triticum dicoccoides TaxID=85692 RepID=UPI00188E0850|nr:riboflavin biosynthesis protein PYRR, chloroplastic-like isoform X2 [Triticum dicoccoides]
MQVHHPPLPTTTSSSAYGSGHNRVPFSSAPFPSQHPSSSISVVVQHAGVGLQSGAHLRAAHEEATGTKDATSMIVFFPLIIRTSCTELRSSRACRRGAGERPRGTTAYLNLEPGDCYGDSTAVSSLVQEEDEDLHTCPHAVHSTRPCGAERICVQYARQPTPPRP